jgi:hypothetical protein
LNGQPPSLCTQSFYDDLSRRAATWGRPVVNILGIDDSMDLYLERMDLSFGGTLLTCPPMKTATSWYLPLEMRKPQRRTKN